MLAALYFQRSLEIPGAPEDESFGSLAPAAALAVRLEPWSRFFFLGGARVSYLAFQVDGSWRHLGVGELSLGAGVPW